MPLEGIDLNPIDWFNGSPQGHIQAAAAAWNPDAPVSVDQCETFLKAYTDAVVSGKIVPPTPTDGQGGSWDEKTFSWLSSIAPTIPVNMAQAMAMLAGMYVCAKTGKIGNDIWNPKPNIFQQVGGGIANIATGAAKEADSKMNMIIIGALALGALYLFLNKKGSDK